MTYLDNISGYINIDKSIDWTSNDVVRKLKGLLGIKKIGHGGTLDPLATGVLPICINAATKFSEYILFGTKSYRATIKLGEATDTYDSEGSITNTNGYSSVDKGFLLKTLEEFKGTLTQIPPMYSALKHNGKPLYKLAREGIIIKRKPRNVNINKIQLIEFAGPLVTIEINCSHGFYVRSFANDIGERLGTFAHLVSLERTQAGVFQKKDSVSIDELIYYVNTNEVMKYIIPIDYTLSHLRHIHVNLHQEKQIRTGQKISLNGINEFELYNDNEEIIAYSEENIMIGLLTFSKKHLELKPKKILNI
ncbi:MAG: tRNA pseudouridine(55) synthase TruB [Dehalococcoidia bacterium]